MLQQDLSGATVTGPTDGGAILAALRELTVSRYTLNADTAAAPHVGPTRPVSR